MDNLAFRTGPGAFAADNPALCHHSLPPLSQSGMLLGFKAGGRGFSDQVARESVYGNPA
jgi:hypothetical protein